MHDIKNYRAPRRPWRWIAWAALAVAFATVIGPIDYASQLDIEAAHKVARAAIARAVEWR